MPRFLIFVTIINFTFSPVYGTVSIKRQPEKVANGNFVNLVCDVGNMKNRVKWAYEGVTYFSCDPPYTNCFTNTNDDSIGFHDFNVKNNTVNALLLIIQNQNDGTWTCYHGNEKADTDIDNADPAIITGFYVYGPTRDNDNEIRCEVKSQKPTNVVMYAVGYKGTRKLYEKNQTTLIQKHAILTSLLCSDGYIYCNVTNGYGPIISRNSAVNVNCPLKILRDLSTNTTLTFNDRTSYGRIYIYFEGYPRPSWSLYRLGTDGVKQINEGMNTAIRYYNRKTEPSSAYVYINNYDVVKPGRYVLTLKQGNITEVAYLTLIYSETTTAVHITTTIGLMNQSTTFKQENVKSKTPDMTNYVNQNTKVTNVMINMGVAGFVMSLLLVLMLVSVGVFWFIRIKKKPADSTDQNEVYSTTVISENRSHIYETLKK